MISQPLNEVINNTYFPHEHEIHLSQKQYTPDSSAGTRPPIRWKSKAPGTFKVRFVTPTSTEPFYAETTQDVTLYANDWSRIIISNEEAEIFISPKENMLEFQLTDYVSKHITLDLTSFVNSSLEKINAYRATVDMAALKHLTLLKDWIGNNSPQLISLDSFLSMKNLEVLFLVNANAIGDTTRLSELTHLKKVALTPDRAWKCCLSHFSTLTSLTNLSLGRDAYGSIGDLLPIANSLERLNLNRSKKVTGTLKELRKLTKLRTCELGDTGVSGKISDLNGMMQGGDEDFLSLRVSDYITDDVSPNGGKLLYYRTYKITFDAQKNVSSVILV